MFDDIAVELHDTAREKGFWGPPVQMDKYMAKLALVHSELTEILEALRKDKGAACIAEEFADAHIRLLDLWQALRDDGVITDDVILDVAFLNKTLANTQRPTLHGHAWG